MQDPRPSGAQVLPLPALRIERWQIRWSSWGLFGLQGLSRFGEGRLLGRERGSQARLWGTRTKEMLFYPSRVLLPPGGHRASLASFLVPTVRDSQLPPRHPHLERWERSSRPHRPLLWPWASLQSDMAMNRWATSAATAGLFLGLYFPETTGKAGCQRP